MRYTLTFQQPDYDGLLDHLLSGGVEQAAYLLCGRAETVEETRMLVREVIPVPPEQLHSQSATGLVIPASSFLPVLKRADETKACFVFVHSHPQGYPTHSAQDDREERALFRTAYNRIHLPGAVHGSVVVSREGRPVGRVWLDNQERAPMEMVRVMGSRYRFYAGVTPAAEIDTSFHDRQVRAFGPDLQPVLKALTVGVVGAGGTGSAVIEQLVRLGVGRLVVADGERLERSNVSRVYGSGTADEGSAKTALAHRLTERIGLGTRIDALDRPITFASVLREFRRCDVIFNCTDDEWGRSLLCLFCLDYLIPVFDLGVRIDSAAGIIRSIQGRVTLLEPGRACLFCRGRISAARVGDEERRARNPEEAERLRAEGYASELAEPDPAVITFTTEIAASALSEFLHKLTGFKGGEHDVGEILHRFDATEIKTPGGQAGHACFCGRSERFGQGDQQRFLGMNWRSE